MKEIESLLNGLGFSATRPVEFTDEPKFSGRLNVDSRLIAVELRFTEGKYSFPEAYLPEFKFDPQLKAALGFRHINDSGKLCYIDESRTWWDSANAPQMVAWCIGLITNVLSENLNGSPAQDVITRDFTGYWNSSNLFPLYVADATPNGAVLKQIVEQKIGRHWLVPKDDDTWINIDPKKSDNVIWLVVHIKKAPAKLNTNNWPPKNISSLFEWLEDNRDNSTAQAVHALKRAIYPKGKKKQDEYKSDVGFVLTWPDEDNNPALGCGFRLTVTNMIGQAIAQDRIKQAIKLLKLDKSAIERFELRRADANYIQNRNTPNTQTSLKNKRVILIGAGTIGGHLAKLLCSHSAGHGSKGSLHIVDPDTFSVENNGRHLLGLESLGLNKAEALAKTLQASFPYLTIEGHGKSITKRWSLITENSVVIDATGFQTVSIALSDYLSTNKLSSLVLHSWVHGHGAATLALLSDRKNNKHACFRCLWQAEGESYKPRYDLTRTGTDDSPTFVGCHESFHPYAATISMLAATQAMQLLDDHLNDRQTDTLKINILRNELCQNRPDSSPEPLSDCPLCNPS